MRDDVPMQLAFDDAQAIVDRVAAQHRMPVERLALARTHGRILAEDVIAAIPSPPFDNSAMDGFAVRHADLAGQGDTTLPLAGEQFAGLARDLVLAQGTCIRITTGAPMPTGADTVVIREVVRDEGDRIVVPAGIVAGANVRHAGEDVRIGDTVLDAGCVLTPARVATAASLGVDQLSVFARPTVAVFTTGDELVPPGMPLAPGQIHDSNRELLMGLLRADGLEPTAWPALPDNPERVESVLRDAASSFDLVITCGGVSVGEKDHVPAMLVAHGEIHFWKVRMKPGMPLLFGTLDRARFLGLPGNPVSVFATYATLGRRLLDGLQGRTQPRRAFRAQLAAPIDKPHARREFLRGRLDAGADGVLRAWPDAATGSHRLHAAARADALIVVPEGPQQLPAGTVVDVLPY
ncbi:molybdopterin molybdenumtransferase MoeA [Lysobacter helvus]|uniref:Molybdopterin molybdenumtransferase n=2 Tax=Lysobacteraceae TaxID=32033 RepID=A0ABM7Q8U5_9GAMM|nr:MULTISPECIES: gephyrin-like molybdotransferase Glp [Lysobacter]BCT93792.1 molybdopterin molybdenumtransferase MoeA [Lysobacter caseinilyticus]BCT96948.1 molybdopterin molybdenumtransferase MoeA [Lysobacter helvus]